MKYRTIVADPPWTPVLGSTWKTRFTDKARPQKHYDTMSLEDIRAVPIDAAPQAHLWLWVLSQHVDWGYDVARAWDFEPAMLLTWAKPGLGVGRFQCNTEHVLLCRRGSRHGNPFGPTGGTVFHWPRGRHSEKPDDFYDLVEHVSPGPYLELFARRRRHGWDVLGNEAPEFAASQAEMGFSAMTPVVSTRAGQPWTCEWCGASLTPREGVWTDETTNSGDYCPEGREVGRDGTSPHLPVRAISSSDDTTQETQDGEREPCDCRLHAPERFGLVPTPDMGQDDRDREVERDSQVERERAVTRIARRAQWALTHYDQPLDGDLSIGDIHALSRFIAEHVYDAGLRASGTDTSPGLASAGGTEG